MPMPCSITGRKKASNMVPWSAKTLYAKPKRKAITKLAPKITGMLPPFTFSSVMPAAFIQALPKTFLWYQMNPTSVGTRAATN